MRLSERSDKLKPSATLAVAARAKQLKREGKNVVSFATGEPDFNTPSNVIEVAKQSMDRGKTRYVESAGIPEFREAISEKLRKDNNLDYSPDEIVVTTGAKPAIFNALQLLLNEGDEVIIVAPYWVSYPSQIKQAGGEVKAFDSTIESGFKITAGDLKNILTEQTKILILNSPSNPTGAVYTKEELEEIAKVAIKNNLIVISDEIYEKLIYDDLKHISIALFDGMKERTIVINGLSKAYAMTGWRVGYLAAPLEFAKKMKALVGQQTTCVPGFVQDAAITGLKECSKNVLEMTNTFSKRRDHILNKLDSIDGLSVFKPGGAFYVWVDVRKFLGSKIKSSLDLAKYLLEEKYLAVVPGEAFGSPGFLRFSYAASIENINEGVKRLEEGLKDLS